VLRGGQRTEKIQAKAHNKPRPAQQNNNQNSQSKEQSNTQKQSKGKRCRQAEETRTATTPAATHQPPTEANHLKQFEKMN
jgi:hypothetical protein